MHSDVDRRVVDPVGLNKDTDLGDNIQDSHAKQVQALSPLMPRKKQVLQKYRTSSLVQVNMKA
jgi:hypothetical protein